MKKEQLPLRKDGKTIHLGKITKDLRKVIGERRDRERQSFLQSFRILLSKDIISPEDLRNLEKIISSLFPMIEINIKLKKDGTPDLRSFPKDLREAVKEAIETYRKMTDNKLLEIETKETISEDDLLKLIQVDKSENLSKKWVLFPKQQTIKKIEHILS